MKKKNLLRNCLLAVCLISCLTLCFAQISTMAAEDENSTNIKLYARAAVLMDADSGRVLFAKNAEEILPMASTTKIMTCIVALENGNLEDVVSVSGKAARQPKVHLGMREGQQFQLKDLLYSLMLESHNDSAVAIAEHVGGSVEDFAAMMNQKAKDLGCFQTFFITPNGLDASGVDQEGNTKVHSTTAEDLARIMKYCIGESGKKEEFLKITRTSSYSFLDTEKKRSYSINNHNAFLTMMQGALSGKTGFTNNAGYCYVGALEQEDRRFVVALLACGWPNNRSYKWTDTKKLMNYGLEHYQYVDVFEQLTFGTLLVEGAIPAENNPFDTAYVDLELAGGNDRELRLLLKDQEQVEMKINLKKKLTAPVEKGQPVGTVRYYLGQELMEEYTVVTKERMKQMNFAWILEYIFQVYLL